MLYYNDELHTTGTMEMTLEQPQRSDSIKLVLLYSTTENLTHQPIRLL